MSFFQYLSSDPTRSQNMGKFMTGVYGPEGPKIGSGGGYHDELVKESGSWLFRYRKIDRFIAP